MISRGPSRIPAGDGTKDCVEKTRPDGSDNEEEVVKAFRSIRFQTIGVVTSVGIVIGLILALATPQRATNLGRQILKNDTEFITGLLAENLGLAVESMILDDGEALTTTLAALRAQNERTSQSLKDIRVYGKTGKLLASLDGNSTGGDRSGMVSEVTSIERDDVIQVTSPLVNGADQVIGLVQVEFSKAFLQEQASGYRWFAVVAALVAIFIASLAGFLLSRSIAQPLHKLSVAADAIANGDIEHHISIRSRNEIGDLAASFFRLIDYMQEMSNAAREIARNNLTVAVIPRSDKDALGTSFNTMVRNLSAVIYQLSENADNLGSSATRLGELSQEMLEGADGQQQQITQVSAAIQQMAATIEESSRHAGDAANASQQAAGTADTGGRVVGDTREAMKRIAETVQAASGSISELSESAEQISSIIGVIDEVADQTNMLALNAAIEAARAGEQGRGFAVVADEVRKLAERTGKATAEIAGMIKNIQKRTQDVVGSMSQNIDEVNGGSEMAERASQSLTEIVSMAQHVTNMITQIATASDEQAAAAGQMSENAEQILAVTRATTDGARQSAEAARGLAEQAHSLRQLVAKFELPDMQK